MPSSRKSKTLAEKITDAYLQRPLKPEWLRPRDAWLVFGISRSDLYKLMDEGLVKSACLRKRGAERGKRLVSFDSLANYISDAAEKEEKRAA
jgi:hypothetical protein